MNDNRIYSVFRWLAKRASGSGLRERFNIIDTLYKKINQSLSPRYAIIEEKKFYLDDGDSLGLSVNGYYEQGISVLIHEIVQDGQVVIDIGANIGYFTVMLSELAGINGKVYAFEPDSFTFSLLEKNIRINKCENVILEKIAVSSVSGNAYLHRDKFHNLDHRLTFGALDEHDLAVNTVSLDDYINASIMPKVDFIKMDIQGAELLALMGMRNLLMKSNSIRLLIEFWPKGLIKLGDEEAPSRLLDMLRSMGFSIFVIDQEDGQIRQFNESNLDDITPDTGKYVNLLCFRE